MTFPVTERLAVRRPGSRRDGRLVYEVSQRRQPHAHAPGYTGPFRLTPEASDTIIVGAGLISIGSAATIKEWPGSGEEASTPTVTIALGGAGNGTVYIWFAIEVNAANGEPVENAYDLQSGTSLPALTQTAHHEIIGAVTLTGHVIDYVKQYKYGDIYVPISVFIEDSYWGVERLHYAGLFIGGQRGIPYAKANSIDSSVERALGNKDG